VHPTISPYETFEASDGWINVGVANDKFWALFCGVIDRRDLQVDARFDAAPRRAANRAVLAGILRPIFASRTRDDWLGDLRAAGIPAGAIKRVGEVCEAPQLMARGMVQSVRHRVSGDVRFIARPTRFDDRPPAPSTAPPLLGEHTAEVLTEWLAWDGPVVAKYAGAGAFGARDGSATTDRK
jgi:formyl-CoA transferase